MLSAASGGSSNIELPTSTGCVIAVAFVFSEVGIAVVFELVATQCSRAVESVVAFSLRMLVLVLVLHERLFFLVGVGMCATVEVVLVARFDCSISRRRLRADDPMIPVGFSLICMDDDGIGFIIGGSAAIILKL